MRELTFEEMEQVAGGGIIGKLGDIFLDWAVTKALDYIWENGGAYFDYLTHCWATYGAGPYDYSHVS